MAAPQTDSNVVRETVPGKPNAGEGRAADKEQTSPQPAPQGLTATAASVAGTLESAASKSAESAVGGRGFAALLGMVTENVIAVSRIGADLADLAVRNLRLAGRTDLARLGAQQARTEDKLETLLLELERLQAELRRSRSTGTEPGSER